ncbi:hypothetical protein Hanom_Chr04g00331881 [Helianthus anomalus]
MMFLTLLLACDSFFWVRVARSISLSHFVNPDLNSCLSIFPFPSMSKCLIMISAISSSISISS